MTPRGSAAALNSLAKGFRIVYVALYDVRP
jgi:hypothetical protein